MPDKRIHRGSHPQDAKLFAPEAIGDLRTAVADFSLLLTKGYAEKSALKLVGDKFSLAQRQRSAVMRCSCSDEQLGNRRASLVGPEDIADQSVVVDGYNVLITIEAAMSGARIFVGRDGCFKDLAGIHGTYRKVTETIPAVQLIGEFLTEVKAGPILWLLDSPVSNSGRLKTLISEIAKGNSWNWQIELLPNPDVELMKTDIIAATNDGIVLDRCKKWINLAAEIIKAKLTSAKVIDLAGQS